MTPLNGEDLLGQKGKNGRLIAAARPDFERAVGWQETQSRGHGSDNVRLRNSLTTAYGQGHVFVGARAELLRHKFVAWELQHGAEDAAVFDTAAAQLLFDHFRALGRVLTAFRHG